MADSATQNPGARSKTADEALVEVLRAAKFQGDAWDRFAQELARYGLPIMKSWIFSMQIFEKCAEKNVGCPGPAHNIQSMREDDASWMADEVVARALNKFRDKVLRPGRWSPNGGSSLNTTFVTQCIFQFPNVYRHWLVENKQDPEHDLEELELMDAGPDGDPAGLVMIREEIAHALEHYVKDPRIAQILMLKAWGYTMKETAEMLDTTAKALDGVLQRHWRTLRERLRSEERGELEP
jgi:DNA-directed RNA polymerase specialized sigma24 family protein